MATSTHETEDTSVCDYFDSVYFIESRISFCEDLDHYADGTLFPVHIGDLFPPPNYGDESHVYRYKIFLKIGHGSYSTVWLALDLETETHVALKFLSSGREEELCLYESLSQARAHEGQRSIVSLLDSFHVGRKNEHVVLVFDVLIPLSLIKPAKMNELDLESMVSQLSLGLSFLHSNNITHGDLHNGNLALKITPEFLFTEDEFLSQLAHPILVPILPLPYSKERRYMRRVLEKEGALSRARLKIIDLSNAYQDTPIEIPLTWYTVRAPEAFMEKLVPSNFHSGRPADIWSLAVNIFELLSARRESLYEAYIESEFTIENMITELGTPRKSLPKSWSEALSQAGISFKEPPSPPNTIKGLSLLDEMVRPEYFALLRDMLIFDPARRPSCEEVCLRLSKINGPSARGGESLEKE